MFMQRQSSLTLALGQSGILVRISVRSCGHAGRKYDASQYIPLQRGFSGLRKRWLPIGGEAQGIPRKQLTLRVNHGGCSSQAGSQSRSSVCQGTVNPRTSPYSVRTVMLKIYVQCLRNVSQLLGYCSKEEKSKPVVVILPGRSPCIPLVILVPASPRLLRADKLTT